MLCTDLSNILTTLQCTALVTEAVNKVLVLDFVLKKSSIYIIGPSRPDKPSR